MNKNKNVNDMIDRMDEVSKAIENRLTEIVKQLTSFSGKQDDIPALFADLTWKILHISTNIQPNLRNILLEFVEKENLDVNDSERIN